MNKYHDGDVVSVFEKWTTLIEDDNTDELSNLISDGELSVNGPIINGLTPLHIACIIGNVKIVRFLISCGADIDAKSMVGRSPIYEAVYYGNIDCVDLLIASGANTEPLNGELVKMFAS